MSKRLILGLSPDRYPYDEKWRDRFMALAAHVASWSKDPSTKVGCVIVNDDRIVVGLGYNGFPRGVGDVPSRYQDKKTKYALVVHSEANAILNATASVRDCTLFCTKSCCSECVKLIIQSGISRIVTPKPATEGVWAEDAQYASQMLQDVGMNVEIVDA